MCKLRRSLRPWSPFLISGRSSCLSWYDLCMASNCVAPQHVTSKRLSAASSMLHSLLCAAMPCQQSCLQCTESCSEMSLGSSGGARAHDCLPHSLEGREGRAARQSRLPRAVQLGHWSIQGCACCLRMPCHEPLHVWRNGACHHMPVRYGLCCRFVYMHVPASATSHLPHMLALVQSLPTCPGWQSAYSRSGLEQIRWGCLRLCLKSPPPRKPVTIRLLGFEEVCMTLLMRDCLLCNTQAA